MIGRQESMTRKKVEEKEMRQIQEETDQQIYIFQKLQTDLKEVEILQEMVPEEMIEAPQETGETNQETDMKEEETVPEKEMIEDQKAEIPKMILGTKKMITEGQKTRNKCM